MTLPTLDPHGKSGWRLEFLELRNQDVRALSEAELPNAPTQERSQQLQARSLLGGGGAPEGNRTVSWIWRGSLQGLDTHEDFGEGSKTPFPALRLLTLFHRISARVVKDSCTPGPLEGGSISSRGRDEACSCVLGVEVR